MSAALTPREELRELLAERAFRFGDFVLTSGRRSDYYVDGKQVTLDGRGLYLVASLALDLCSELDVEAVGGLTLGADPIAAAVAALSGATPQPLRAFIVRKVVKEHGTAQAIEGPPLRSGMRVLLVDDTLTTGGTFLEAQQRVLETGAAVAGAFCVVDREEGGAAALAARHIPLHALFVANEFRMSDAAVSTPSRGA
jgi:orotate phosphoribosyltransferase